MFLTLPSVFTHLPLFRAFLLIWYKGWKLIYASTIKCPFKQILDQKNIVHKSFIWDNKKPKTKQSTLIADYSEGGYKDIDIETKISAPSKKAFRQ